MSDTTPKQLVVFSLGEEEYALPITTVQEIIHYTEPRAVASDATVDPRRDLPARQDHPGLRPRRPPRRRCRGRRARGKIVIVETGTVAAGVIVDDVEEVLTVDDEQLEDVPPPSRESIDAIAKIDDRLIVLLDLDGLFGRGPPTELAAQRGDRVATDGPAVSSVLARSKPRIVVADDSALHAPAAPDALGRRASTSSATAATATRRSRCAARCVPT